MEDKKNKPDHINNLCNTVHRMVDEFNKTNGERKKPTYPTASAILDVERLITYTQALVDLYNQYDANDEETDEAVLAAVNASLDASRRGNETVREKIRGCHY